ncbi:MAG: CHRD domain-containing protein [Nitrososphaeraceae archaeon]
MHKQLHWINSAAVEESGNDISYEINVQNIEKITAAHIHMGRSGKKMVQ